MIMNKKTLLMALILPFTQLMAQSDDMLTEEIVIPLSNPGEIGTLEVNQIYGGIKVTGYDGKEVIVIARQKRMKSTVQMKNGLRKIQNNSMALEAEESNNYVEIESQIYNRNDSNTMNLEVKVPRNFNLKLQNVNDGKTWVENVNGEMEISNVNNDITLNQVSGSALVDTVNGVIKATFKQVTNGSKMVLTSFKNDIDLTLPSNIKADFKLRTNNGEILTGFDIKFDTSEPVIEKNKKEKSYKIKLEKWITGKANGGGTEIVLKSHSGDLIVRSQDK
jgi:hypothetical protein